MDTIDSTIVMNINQGVCLLCRQVLGVCNVRGEVPLVCTG